MSKICTNCNIPKDIKLFYRQSKGKDGFNTQCKNCLNIKRLKYLKTKDGFITNIYSSQIGNSRKRKHTKPLYTKRELKDWILNHRDFEILWQSWIESDYDLWERPSIDRFDDSKGYSLSNIRLTTWRENNSKSFSMLEKPILQMEGVRVMRSFKSSREAERVTGINHTSICKVIMGNRPSAGGFKWKYD